MADNHGMEHQAQFIQQVVMQQRADKRATTGDRNVLARLLLKLGDLGHNIARYQGRVGPFSCGQGGRHNKLGRVIHEGCKLVVAGLGGDLAEDGVRKQLVIDLKTVGAESETLLPSPPRTSCQNQGATDARL